MSEETSNRVAVTDVNMPFMSMVRFMVKWAIAAIPAMLILMVIGAIFCGVLVGVMGSIGAAASKRSSEPAPVGGESVARTEGSTATDTVEPTNAAEQAYLSKVQVKNVRVSQSYVGEPGVFGEVKNTGERTLKKVELTIFCLDAAGKPVYEKTYRAVSDSAFNSDGPLKPGYSRQFGVKVDEAPCDWAKKADVKVTSVAFE
jgi:hypothetical protein